MTIVPVDIQQSIDLIVKAAGGDKLLSLESAVLDFTSNNNLAAGFTHHQSSPVPANKLWVVPHISWIYIGTAPANVRLFALHAGNYYPITQWVAPAQNVYYPFTTRLYLPAGAQIDIEFRVATLGDACQLTVLGSQMDAP